MRRLRAVSAFHDVTGSTQALPGRICFSCPGCSASTEMGVRHQPKQLFGFIRNRCTTSSEIAVRHTPKWLFVFARDTQLRDINGRNITNTLAEYLRSLNLLLVLDNCEHLI